MTPKQIEVLGWIQKGLNNKQIAYRMNISVSTVKLHVSALLKKFAVQTRQQLALYSLGSTVPVLPVLEVTPYCWIKATDSFLGVSFNNQPDPSWVAVYRK